jgi:acyl transferase domain-containing protein/thioesterase domain-containing protein/acyl carrier protein
MEEQASVRTDSTDVAIVGLAGRFPGADTPAALWRNLRDGVESIRHLRDEDLLAAGVDPATLADPNYVRMASVLDGIDQFDASFFGFSPKDAAILDPQHRHFLECAWEALEDAAHTPEKFPGSIGVFAGCGMNAYFMFNLLTNPQLVRSVGLFLLRHTGNDKDFLATRASYCFNLTGPSVSIQTACSTSLVAIHTACQSLLSGECDMALAGGVTIELPHGRGYLYEESEILSLDGHCRAFDEQAKGTIFGSGVGVVVLRRLSDAIADGDQIHAVIKGSAVNNDGSRKIGYLAPSVDGQAKAISEALSLAGVHADSIGYVEAHGTGTPVGDAIEIAALTQAFRTQTERRGFCAIGSLKTNIGHLDTAAGVAGLIKVVLALKHRQIPPSLNCQRPNPAIGFEQTPFTVNTGLVPWTRAGMPRRAGVNSLGIGGTNAHAIIEEAPARGAAAPSNKSRQLIVLSARSVDALDRAATRLADFLDCEAAGTFDADLGDVAFTLQSGRRRFPHRRALVCRDRADAVLALRRPEAKSAATRAAAANDAPQVVFLFPGGGAQFPGMGEDLYREEPVYREELDKCLAWIARRTGEDFRSVLFPSERDSPSAAHALERPSNSVLSVFMTGYALGKLWMSWGIRPAAMIGHSLGEYTAACLAGVLSLEGALTLVAIRGSIFERLPPGAMIAVPLTEREVQPLLSGRLSIAAVNAPSLSMVSGPVADIDAFEREMATGGYDTRRVRISVAAHSRMLDPYLGEFAAAVRAIEMKPATVPLISNETGTWASSAELMDPQYWVRQLRGTVRFSQGLLTAAGDRAQVFLEVGPGQSLSALARLHLEPSAAGAVIPSMRHPQQPGSDVESLYSAAGRLWVSGHDLDWSALHGAPRRRVSLPTYPFEHRRHWIEAAQPPALVGSTEEAASAATPSNAPARLEYAAAWFWKPVWHTVPKPAARPLAAGGRWLLFDHGSATGAALSRLLEQVYAQQVVAVAVGQCFERRSDGMYTVRPGERTDYDALLETLKTAGGVPLRVVHMWLASDALKISDAGGSVQELAFESLFYLAQALAAADLSGPVTIHVVTDRMERIADEPVGDPQRALAIGPALVIPREFPNVACGLIDIEAPASNGPSETGRVASELFGELVSDVSDTRVALRSGQRWVWDLEPEPAADPAAIGTFPRAGATYLVTGGLSGIGLELAERMGDAASVNLALLSRRGLPPRSSWEGLLREAPDHNETLAIGKILKMEAAGARVTVLTADLVDPPSVARAIADVRQQFGHIDGVLHAAGIVEDGPLQLKARDSFVRVLAPKVRGLLTLEAALGDDPPELLVLFSSTSAFLGLPGQVDYTAANAFLNAYAREKTRLHGRRTVSVQWGVWRDVGIAARLVCPRIARSTARGLTDQPERHPLLGRVIRHDTAELVCEADWSIATHWILSEHRLRTGEAIVPGTAIIELARAAFLEATGSATVEIRDLYFLEPLHVRNDERRLVQTRLRLEGEGWALSVQSVSGDSWIEHASATLASLDDHHRPPRVDIATLGVGAPHGTLNVARPALQASYLDFGPRWRNVREMRIASDRSVAVCELSADLRTDLDAFTAHPALLDMALSCGLALLDRRQDLYVPFSYDAIRVYAPVGASVIGIVTLVEEPRIGGESVGFNATLTDSAGVVLIEVEALVMRRTSLARVTARLCDPITRVPVPPPNPRLAALVQAGIRTDDGWRALLRVLNETALPEIVVSSIDVNLLRASTNGSALRPRSTRAPPLAGELRSQPEDTAATAIATMWQELLGVDDVGLDQDFFELGGHSLIALRLVSRMETTFKKKLRLATLFEARTVRQLAALVGERQARHEWLSLVPIQPHGSKPPFFCVHALGGEVLTYASLGTLCAPHQPFIGFRAPGHDGQSEPLRTIEEQATLYIREMAAYQAEGPYYIGGYSHGGRVALEMALQLEAAGKEVAFLGIIDTWPQNIQQRSPRYAARLLRNLFLWAYYDARQETWRRNVDRLRRGGRVMRRRLAALILWRQKAGAATTADADVREVLNIDKLPEAIQRVFQQNFAAFCNYRPAGRCGPLTLFRATVQPLFGPHQPDLGWGRVSRVPVQVRHLHGSHSSIIQSPQVLQLAQELMAALDEAQERAKRSRHVVTRGTRGFDLAGTPYRPLSEVQPVRAAAHMSPTVSRP